MSSEALKFLVDDTELTGILEKPSPAIQSVVIILHPHPLYGGDMHNPVVTKLSNAILSARYATFRFNFRGVSNRSEYHGLAGAVDDVLHAAKILNEQHLQISGIAGYSFGGSTALRYSSLYDIGFLISVSSSLVLYEEDGFQANQLSNITCPVLMLHGTSDLTVPYENMNKISSYIQSEAKCVSLENEGHFYHHSLERVKDEVADFIRTL